MQKRTLCNRSTLAYTICYEAYYTTCPTYSDKNRCVQYYPCYNRSSRACDCYSSKNFVFFVAGVMLGIHPVGDRRFILQEYTRTTSPPDLQ